LQFEGVTRIKYRTPSVRIALPYLKTYPTFQIRSPMAIRVLVTLLPPALLVVISLWQRMEVTSVISRCWAVGNMGDLRLWFTLQGTNISPKNGILKMIFLFPRWGMLIFLEGIMFIGFPI